MTNDSNSSTATTAALRSSAPASAPAARTVGGWAIWLTPERGGCRPVYGDGSTPIGVDPWAVFADREAAIEACAKGANAAWAADQEHPDAAGCRPYGDHIRNSARWTRAERLRGW